MLMIFILLIYNLDNGKISKVEGLLDACLFQLRSHCVMLHLFDRLPTTEAFTQRL